MLWIISQDKKNVVNVKEMYVSHKAVVGIIEKRFLTTWSQYLGSFDTHERALEVVEEIYKSLKDSDGFITTYTMPEK